MTTKTMPLGEKLAADIRAVAAALGVLADSIAGATPSKANVGDGSASESAAATENFSTPSRISDTAEESELPITLAQVRAVLTEKSRSGLTAQVKALLTKHDAGKLSDIDPADYAALLSEAEGLS